MACGLPVIVTGAGPALDYASDETAFLIPAHRGNFPECRVGDMETIGRPWLSEPDQDALVELLRRVASDPAAARAKGAAASKCIREHFTWERSAEAAERRLRSLVTEGIQPRMNTDLHGWEGRGERERNGFFHELSDPLSSDPCQSVSIRGSESSDSICGSLTRSVRISLTMIVKNEEANIQNCLASVAGLFDEIVVVDTGSTDRTMEIAREFGARVFDFVWVDDFAAARNAALVRARGRGPPIRQ